MEDEWKRTTSENGKVTFWRLQTVGEYGDVVSSYEMDGRPVYYVKRGPMRDTLAEAKQDALLRTKEQIKMRLSHLAAESAKADYDLAQVDAALKGTNLEAHT